MVDNTNIDDPFCVPNLENNSNSKYSISWSVKKLSWINEVNNNNKLPFNNNSSSKDSTHRTLTTMSHKPMKTMIITQNLLRLFLEIPERIQRDVPGQIQVQLRPLEKPFKVQE